jgi:hypothetical protein
MTTGRRGLLGMGTAAASAWAAGRPDGAAGGLKPEYPAASGPRDYGRGPTTGTRSQTTCYVRRGTGRVVPLLILALSFLEQRSLKIQLGPTLDSKELEFAATTTFQVGVILNQSINTRSGSGRLSPPLPTSRVRYTRVLQQPSR